ncbi:hypothetical protein MLA2C4_11660 [Bacillus mobilis]|nr:hypothetical protein MLA2C4_11660 [Bacillus mobilis]
MKTKGLSRGEILIGMEQGTFKAGTKFKDVSKRGVGAIAHVVCDESCETALYWEKEERIVQLRNCLTEKWDLIEPIKGDDWVHITEDERDHYIAKVEQVTGDVLVVDETIYINNAHRHVHVSKARKATTEEIAQEKRRRVFAKVGREVDEFKPGDVVKHYCINWFVSYIREDGDVAIIHQCDDSWASGKELEPVYFVDNMVKEDN